MAIARRGAVDRVCLRPRKCKLFPGALDQLLDSLSLNPNVTEITVLAHSMGCALTLEALRSKATRSGRIGNKIKNVLLVAPDVSVDDFRTELRSWAIGGHELRLVHFTGLQIKARMSISQRVIFVAVA